MSVNFYQILGVDQNCTSEELKKAYRVRMMQYHPDKNPHGDTTFLKLIQTAYEALSQPERRQAYDTQLNGKRRARPTSDQVPRPDAASTAPRQRATWGRVECQDCEGTKIRGWLFKAPCGTCDATGMVEGPVAPAGRSLCPRCEGESACDHSDPDGRGTCAYCLGTGLAPERVRVDPCAYCSGLGFSYSYERGARYTCANCNGTGKSNRTFTDLFSSFPFNRFR